MLEWCEKKLELWQTGLVLLLFSCILEVNNNKKETVLCVELPASVPVSLAAAS